MKYTSRFTAYSVYSLYLLLATIIVSGCVCENYNSDNKRPQQQSKNKTSGHSPQGNQEEINQPSSNNQQPPNGSTKVEQALPPLSQ